MKQFTTIGTFAGITALSLVALAGPATASGHSGKSPKLTHTHLTLKATQERVTKNDKFKASVVAKLRAKKAGLSDETVGLSQRADGATKWLATGQTGTTAADGTVAFTFTQGVTKEQYRVVFAGDSTYHASHSGTITIKKLKSTKSVEGS